MYTWILSILGVVNLVSMALGKSIQGNLQVIHPLALKNKLGKVGEEGKIDAALGL